MLTPKQANKLNILDISKPTDPRLSGELNRLSKEWVELVLNCLQYSQPDGLNSSGIVASPTVPLAEIRGKI